MSSPSVFETFSPNRLFLRCALPNMISMAASSLYTIADGIFVGRFLGEEALAAVNLVMPFLFIGFVFSDMVAVGSSVQIAIHLGEHREREASVIFTRCSLLIEAIALAVGVLGFFFARPLLELMGADPSVTQLACQYLQVFALFTPAVMIYFAVDNYLRICGLTRYSMVLNVTASLLNIGLDYLFLAVFRWGIASAALASCLSLALGSLMGLLPLIGGKLPLRFVKGRLRRGLLKNILYNQHFRLSAHDHREQPSPASGRLPRCGSLFHRHVCGQRDCFPAVWPCGFHAAGHQLLLWGQTFPPDAGL